MSGNKLLLDTNVLIYLSKSELDISAFAGPEDLLSISVITLMEVKGYAFKSRLEEKFINDLCNHFTIEYINEAIVDEVVRIRKIHRIKLPDAIILATAKTLGLSLVTRNVVDFKAYETMVHIIDPFLTQQ